MSVDPLLEKHCHPCAAGTPAMDPVAAQQLLKQLDHWEIINGKCLRKTYPCKDFMTAVGLIQRLASIAEANNHHPDLHLTGYKSLTVELSTHSIGGLSDNDFILAAKIDRIITHFPPP